MDKSLWTVTARMCEQVGWFLVESRTGCVGDRQTFGITFTILMSKWKLLILKMRKRHSDEKKLMVPATATYFCLSHNKFYITEIQNVLGQDFKAGCKSDACFYRHKKIIASSSSQEVI